jgi:uroporphyrinogen decarboxylase
MSGNPQAKKKDAHAVSTLPGDVENMASGQVTRAEEVTSGTSRRPGDRISARERVTCILERRVPDRVAIHDSYWSETIDRWKREGMPAEADAQEYFGTEIRGQGYDASFQLEQTVLEETAEYTIIKDTNGVTSKRFRQGSGWTPHWLDWTIKTPEDWYRLRERMAANPERMGNDALEANRRLRRTDKWVCFTCLAPYEGMWGRVGQVRIFEWMMDEPRVVEDMCRAQADQSMDVFRLMVERGLEFDGVWAWGDLGYRGGPHFSPAVFRELVWPHHRRMNDFFHGHGMRTILHSCGRIEPILPLLIEAGWDAIQPLEAKSGQDVRRLKAIYGTRIVFFGNIDVRSLSGSRDDIVEEVRSKLTIAKEHGGYIYHSDHSVPPTVSLDNYRFALSCVEEYGRY